MGIMVGLPSPGGSEKDLQLNFGKNMTVQVELRALTCPPNGICKAAYNSLGRMPVQTGHICWKKCRNASST